MPNLPSWDKERLAGLFREAGAIALGFYERPAMELKLDATVVTSADRAVEARFVREFDHPEAGSYLIGEETAECHTQEYLQAALAADCTYVLDPIDGTTPYTLHLPVWSISLGLMERGILTEGALYIPTIDQLLVTENGKLYTQSLNAPDEWHDFEPAAGHLGLAGHIGIGQLQARSWSFAGKNQLIAWSGCASMFYKVLTGELLGYVGDFKLWDAAAMLPVYRAAGACMKFFLPGAPELSSNLANHDFELAPGQRRWRIKAPIAAAQSPETAEWLINNFSPNQPKGC